MRCYAHVPDNNNKLNVDEWCARAYYIYVVVLLTDHAHTKCPNSGSTETHSRSACSWRRKVRREIAAFLPAPYGSSGRVEGRGCTWFGVEVEEVCALNNVQTTERKETYRGITTRHPLTLTTPTYGHPTTLQTKAVNYVPMHRPIGRVTNRQGNNSPCTPKHAETNLCIRFERTQAPLQAF